MAGRPAVVGELLARCTFPEPGTEVVCAFSGGADSTALLVLASAAGWASRRSMSTTASGLRRRRRPAAASDLARTIGVPCRVVVADIPAGANLEARARAARREVLPPDALTGHTADDRAETLLVNLLRGAGLDGLAAMAPGPTRPLLALRRADTRRLCAELSLVPVDDPSNEDARFVRNRVRHELLPLMDSIAGRDTVPLLVRTAETAADDAALAESAGSRARPDRRPGDHRRGTGRRPPGAAAMADGRRLPTRRGDHRPRPGRRRRRPAGLRDARRAPRRTSPPAAAHRGQRRSNLAGRDEQHQWRSTLMATRLRGRWALGITPRNFTWILKDKLAICERPGGYGENHRRVRRQEEIIWIRENGFGCVISIIPAPHNLHNYDELGVTSRHRPFNADELEPWLRAFYRELNELLKAGVKVIVHGEEVGDRIVGIMGGYIRWAGLVDDDTQAITVTERLAGRQLDPFARNVILLAPKLR